jgi:hypothetical protein
MGAGLMVYLGTLYVVAMLVMWYCLQGQRRERTPPMQVPFALTEGQTILGVMDTTEIMCFCIGELENHVPH